MTPVLTSAQLIDRKYEHDGPDVVHTYQHLRFDKHIRLMRDHMGLKPGAEVLDIGCGTGALLVELAMAGARVTGIDTFEEANGIDLEIVQARLRESGVQAEVQSGTAVSLQFPDNSFDLAVNIGMLEHIPPDVRKGVLAEMYRVVRPGGCLFLIAGPTTATPLDQHIPGHPFANWLSREKKVEISRKAGRRQFLEIPWGISRKELATALPGADIRSLYSAFFALDGGQPLGRFRPNPLWLLTWAKRHLHLHRVIGAVAQLLYVAHQEHCHILKIGKPR